MNAICSAAQPSPCRGGSPRRAATVPREPRLGSILIAAALAAAAPAAFAQTADVAVVAKTVSVATPTQLQAIVYTVVASNRGPAAATGFTVSDVIPQGLTFVSASATQGTYDPTTGVWTIGTLASNLSRSLTLNVTVNTNTAGLKITNTASVLSSGEVDPVATNNVRSVTLRVAGSDLEVTKTASKSAPVLGSNFTYTVILTNNGTRGATNIVVTDLLPTQYLTYVTSTVSQGAAYNPTTGVWAATNLLSGGKATLTITATIKTNALGVFVTNTASITSFIGADSVTNNNQSSAVIAPGNPDLQLGKSASVAVANPGDPVTYTISVTNAGPHPATSVQVTDLVPAGLAYFADDGGGAYNPTTGVWSVGTMDAGAVQTLMIVSTVATTNYAGQTILNTAQITGFDQVDPDPANNAASATFQVSGAELGLTLVASTNRPTQGDTLVFTLTVTNNGPDTATGIEILEPLSFAVTYVSHSTTLGTYGPGSNLWTIASLAAGASATLSITTTVTTGDTILNTASILVVDQPDSVTTNNAVTLTIRPYKIFPAGACIIDMGVVPQTYANGLKPFGFIYDLVVKNNVPVWWIIEPTKTSGSATNKVDTYDLIITGKQYKGGPFVIEAQYVPLIQSVINVWTSKGVRIDFNLPQFTAPVFNRITSFPNAVLDLQNGKLIRDAFYVTSEVSTNSYIIGTPADLTACDDVYAMPHADPQDWTDISQYKTKLRDFILSGGYYWGACHAVSALETLVDINADGIGDMNLLTENHMVPWTDHSDGTPPYSYEPSIAGHPYMQFLGTFDGALQNGSEQIFLPSNQGFRASTTVAVWDPTQADVPSLSPGPAMLVAFGPAFGNDAYGQIMYEASHTIAGGTVAENTAAARVYGNFLLSAGLDKRPRLESFTAASVLASGEQGFYSVSVSGGSAPYQYLWKSSGGGVFSDPFAASTYFTAPVVSEVTAIIISVEFFDGCGRHSAQSQVVTVYPPGELALDKTVDKAFVQPGGALTYTLALGPYTNTLAYLTNSRIEDRVPTNTTYVPNSATTNGTFVSASNLIFWTLGSNLAGTPGVFQDGTNITLVATNDTYVTDDTPTTAHGAETNLRAIRIPTENANVLIQFGLPGIPSNAIIETAKLSVYVSTYVPGQTFNVHALTPSGPWTEAGATWNTRNGVNPWNVSGGDYDPSGFANFSATGANSFASADISTLVQAWASGFYTNFGLLLKPLAINGTSVFASRNNSVTNRRPSLALNYYTRRTTTTLGVVPLLVTNGGTVTVTMRTYVEGNTNSVTVTPPASLTVDATGNASAVLLTGPSPASDVVAAGGGVVSFTYTYKALGTITPSSVAFRGTPTSSDPDFPFVEGKSNNSLLAPTLQFQVTVNTNIPLVVTQIFNQASFLDGAGFDSSNRVLSPVVTTLVTRSGFTIFKTLLSPTGRAAAVGETLAFRVTVSNIGQTVLTTVPLQDDFDTNVASYLGAVPAPNVVAAGLLTWTNLGPLAIGASTSVTVQLTALASTAGDVSTNRASASAVPAIGAPLPPLTSTVPYQVVNPAISVVKTLVNPLGRPAVVGEAFVFVLSVTNTGDTVLDRVVVTDAFNTNYLAFLSATQTQSSVTNGTVTWTNVGPLAVGGSVTLTTRFLAIQPGTGTNTAVATAIQTDGTPVAPSTSSAPHTAVSATFTLGKILVSPSGRPAAVGETITFAITLSNSSPVALNPVPLSDAFDPSVIAFLSASVAPDQVNAGSLVWSNVGPLSVGGSITITTRFTTVGVTMVDPAVVPPAGASPLAGLVQVERFSGSAVRPVSKEEPVWSPRRSPVPDSEAPVADAGVLRGGAAVITRTCENEPVRPAGGVRSS